MFGDSYFYTDYDIGDSGHSITINESDREAFLDAFSVEWRKRADDLLEEVEDEEDEENTEEEELSK
jgi:hypothetical protein